MVRCVAFILVLIAWLGVWSNHFENSFHFDDIPTIVTNPSLLHVRNVPRFFTNPRIFSTEKESAAYKPLLSTWFAVDYRFGRGPVASIFQMESFLWFASELLVMFILFQIIPGGNYKSAAFGTLLFGLHPVVADTINYPLQRGIIMGAFSVVSGLAIWIAWPRLLPQTVPIRLKSTPEVGLDQFLRQNFKKISSLYLRFIHAPIAWYLVPVVLGLLAEPATAIFAPLLLAYTKLFERERRATRVIPAAVVCIGYWVSVSAFTWKLGEFQRPSAFNYWITQPWVAMRYLFAFFLPVHLSADTGLQPFAHFWSPLAIAGYAGLAALISLAVVTSRRSEWRGVSFGIWWFLIALLPDAIIPQRVVEANWRMFLPFAGLAFAASRALWVAFERLYKNRKRVSFATASAVLAVAVLCLYGWGTYRRNTVWETEGTLWGDVVSNSPLNGRGYMEYGLTRLTADNVTEADYYLSRAITLSPHDAVIQINLARLYERLSRSVEAEKTSLETISENPSYSPAYSSYAQWLAGHQRLPEAFSMASKALSLDSYDLLARRTEMDIMATRHDWNNLNRIALETLNLYPDEPDSQRSLQVAQTGVEKLAQAENAAREEPSVNNSLTLSVMYFEEERYDDCIRAAREALQRNPNMGEAYANIASAYHMMGKLDEEIAALKEEVRLNPDLPSARSNLQHQLDKKAGLAR